MEIFKSVLGFEGIYEVSNLGRVKSLKRKYRTKDIILNHTITKLGYCAVYLNDNNKRTDMFLHRLVAIAFIPNPENKPCVNHINGIKTDNRLDNLEWCTVYENNIHSYKTGLKVAKKGLNHYRSTFSKEDILEIRNNNLSHRKIAKLYGVSHNVIGDIKRLKSYKDVV